MGNDGGSIPKRRELVKEAAKAPTTAQLKEAATEHQQYAWSTDPLSRKPLARPIVSDAAGMLYNKDALLEFLLKHDDDAEKGEMRKVARVWSSGSGSGSDTPADMGTLGDRVQGLRDVVELRFEIARDTTDGDDNNSNNKGRRAETETWVCPITATVLGPGAKAVYIVPCGHVFAASVVKEVAERACLTCNQPYTTNDIIPIIPSSPTDIARLHLRAKTLRENGLTHALKKLPGSSSSSSSSKKKRKQNANKESPHGDQAAYHDATTTTTTTTIAQPSSSSSSSSAQENTKKEKDKQKNQKPAAPSMRTSTSTSTSLQNAATASLTRKVLEEQAHLNKRRKLVQNENVNSLFNKANTQQPSMGNSADYMTRGFSIGNKK